MAVKIGNRLFKNVDSWQVDYIKRHSEKKLKEIGGAINLDERRVGEIIKLLGIPRERHWKIYLPKTKEVEEELKNPYLSHVEIAYKYKVSEACVAKRRKELGVNSRRKNYDTLIEKQVEEILLILDLAFLKQKRFGRWSVDFYLGRKYCIDVHGEWSHSKRKIIERDKRKKTYFEAHSINYLVIEEKELLQPKKVINRIKQFTLGFPC
ncbi:hypothetical protein J14TS2_08770 [Bacillus sp. J14TS2]|uniref:topoisomerase I n=1 Tax=Bacillus sp. J14TS2 TaxID=2807188 RepID=UPI001B1BE20F|nr:topoisomerase I [Bacillus sp. J14TS2]GIN70402.1 hypothetical protein J14TS2_08770 [Bacillus sp. J14TS2]